MKKNYRVNSYPFRIRVRGGAGPFPKILKKERFVGYYMELPSGWYIAFYLGKTGIERAPKKDDAVCKIFKI